MKIKNTIAFAFEGPDKVGKATQSKLLYDALMDLKVSIHRIEIPSKHHVCYSKIYSMLTRDGDGKADAHEHPEIFQTFIIANRFHVQSDVERMALDRASPVVIIFDRWDASSWCYGNALGISLDKIKVINDGLMIPDITFVLNGQGFSRLEEADDAFEDDQSFQSRVRAEYDRWSKSREDAISIRADRSKEVVHDEIFTISKKYLIKNGIL